MTVIETAGKLVLTSGSTTLSLDTQRDQGTFQRKILGWRMKPTEAPISEIVDVKVGAAIDRASGVEFCSTALVFRSGVAWALPAADRSEAEANARSIRHFLQIGKGSN